MSPSTPRRAARPPAAPSGRADGRGAPAQTEPESELDALKRFLDASPTPYHAVAAAEALLEAAGFARLDDRADWTLSAGDRAYTTRGGSSILALRVGARPPAEAGFRLVGAHTDSPTLRVKPKPGRASAGWLGLDVEVYGSPILATWADRDLGLAGRVVVRERSGLATRLVRIDRPLCRIPTLAIHLSRAVNEEGLRLDRHKEISPALAPWEGPSADDAVRRAIAEAADADARDVLGFDLALFDVQRAAVGGLGGELLFSARLDNLTSCRAALSGLLAADGADATAVAVLFDHEEIGSETAEGASGAWLRDTLDRVEAAFPASGGLPRALARSFLVSADAAHAVHPNYPERHDGHHLPRIGGGPVVKTNASRRYATDAASGAHFRSLCAAEGVPCQEYVHRADLPCGSTIGPLVTAGLGVRGVDVGSPILSMHSAREMGGTKDPSALAAVLRRHFAGAEPLP